MFCKKCGSSLVEDSVFCQKCGERQNAQAAEKVSDFTLSEGSRAATPAVDKRFWSSWSSGRRTWFVIILALTVLAGLNGQNLFSFVTGLATGQVYLDSGKVEANIESGIQSQIGESVTATCPNPMAGKVGESRQCTVVDTLGMTYLVDVTIQSTNGDVTWRVQN